MDKTRSRLFISDLLLPHTIEDRIFLLIFYIFTIFHNRKKIAETTYFMAL